MLNKKQLKKTQNFLLRKKNGQKKIMKKPLLEKIVSQRTIQLRRHCFLSWLATMPNSFFLLLLLILFVLHLFHHVRKSLIKLVFLQEFNLNFHLSHKQTKSFYSDSASCKSSVQFHLIYLYHEGQKQLEAIYGI